MVVIRGHLNLRNFLPFKPCHSNPWHSKCVHFESSLILHDHDLLGFIALALKERGNPKKHGCHPHVDGQKKQNTSTNPPNISWEFKGNHPSMLHFPQFGNKAET